MTPAQKAAEKIADKVSIAFHSAIDFETKRKKIVAEFKDIIESCLAENREETGDNIDGTQFIAKTSQQTTNPTPVREEAKQPHPVLGHEMAPITKLRDASAGEWTVELARCKCHRRLRVGVNKFLTLKTADAFTLRDRHNAAMRELAKDTERYYELIMAVERKHAGESRHETALRYIRQAETYSREPDAARTASGEEEKP